MTVKITLKQLMLIVMSFLLALTIIMFAVVVAKVGNMVKGMGMSSGNQPPVAGTEGAPTEDQNTEPTPTETEEPTQPKETLPDHEHEYVKSQTVAATCTDMGYTIYLCDCGKTDIRDFHDARGHNYGEEERLDATCGKPGYCQATCLRCGVVDTREVYDALEHEYELVKEQKLTCEQDGFEEHKCKHCGDVKVRNEQKAQGHKWKKPSQILAEPTDVAPGQEQKTCEVCGKTETVLIPPTEDVQVQSYGSSTQGDWKAYVFYVGSDSNANAYIYRIWLAVEHGDLKATYSMSGLTVTYTGADGAKLQHILEAYTNGILTIDENGQISHEAPDLGQDPTQEPTTPPASEEPSTPPETEAPTTPPETEAPTTPSETEAPTTPSETEAPTEASSEPKAEA